MTFKSFFTVTALTLSALTCSLTQSSQEIFDQASLTTLINSSAAVVKFSAPWCGPCKAMAPMFEAVSNEPAFSQKVKFGKVDTDRCGQIATSYNIRSVPTTIFFKNGQEVGRINGSTSRQEFVGKIKTYFAI